MHSEGELRDPKVGTSPLHAGILALNSVSRSLNAQHGIFGWIAALSMAIEGIQLASFPWSAIPNAWSAAGPRAVSTALAGHSIINTTSASVAVGFVLAVNTAAAAVIIMYSIIGFSTAKQSGFTDVLMPIARTLSLIATSVAAVPVANIIASAIACSNENSWLFTNVDCSNVAAILARILASLLFLVYNGLLAFVAATYVDRNPASKSWSAKSHGQMDAAMLLVKVALVLCYSVFRDFVLDSWVLVVLLLLAGAAWLGMAVRYLPFVHPGMNAMQAGFASVFLWSTLVLALARYTDTGDQSLLLYLGSVLAYCGGFLACYMHEQFIAALPLEACESLVHLDVWARHRMQEYSRVVESRGSSVEQSRKGQHAVPIRRRPRYGGRIGRDAGNDDEDAEYGRTADNATMGSVRDGDQQADAAEYLQELPTAGGGGGAASVAGGSSGGKSSDPGPARGSVQDGGKYGGMLDGAGTVAYAPTVRTDAGSMARLDAQANHFSKQAGADGEDGHEDDVMQSLLSPEEDIASIDQSTFFGWRLTNMKYATRRHREDEHRLYTAERAYRQMAAHFGQTAMAHVLAAEFYHQFCFENNFAEAQALAQARLRSPSLDLEAYVYGRTRELREGADSSKLSALDRVIFESLSRQAQESKVAAMRSILKLWDHLAGHKLELATVVGVGQEIETDLRKTDELYRTMLRLNQGALVARGYAEFLVELMNDPLTAMELFNKADRLEERHTRQRAKAVRHVVLGSEAPQVDLLDDNAANLTLSVADGSVGEILSASPSTCRVFGFANTSQITGLSFQTLLPEPVRGIYNQRLHRLQRCGFSDALNETEVSFVLPSSGSALPVIISLLESTPDEATSAPRLSVGIDVLRCDEHVIFFSGRDQGYKVLSASARSMLLLGTDSEQLQREPLPLSRYFPTADSVGLRAGRWDAPILEGILNVEATSGTQESVSVRHCVQLVKRIRALRPGGGKGRDGSDEMPALLRESTIGRKGSWMENVDKSRTTPTGAQAKELGTKRGIQWASEQGDDSTRQQVRMPKLPRNLRPKPLIRVYETALIPVQNAADKTDLVLGSVQDVSDQVGRSCFMLRWRMPSQVEREALQEQVLLANRVEGDASAAPSQSNDGVQDIGSQDDEPEVAITAGDQPSDQQPGILSSASPVHPMQQPASRIRRPAQHVGHRRGSFVGRVQQGSYGHGHGHGSMNTLSRMRPPSGFVKASKPHALATYSSGPSVISATAAMHAGLDEAHGAGTNRQLAEQESDKQDGDSSQSSEKEKLLSRLSKAVRHGATAAERHVHAVKCTFMVTILVALLAGIASMPIGEVMRMALDQTIALVFASTDQLLAFQTCDSIYMSVAAQQAGIFPSRGAARLRAEFEDFVVNSNRHEQRLREMLGTDGGLYSDRAGEDARVRQWTLVEPSATIGQDKVFDASLQEMGTFLSSIMLKVAATNDTASMNIVSPTFGVITSNREEYMRAMNQSMSLRQLDVVDSFNQSLATFAAIYAALLFISLGVFLVLIYRALNSIREKTVRVAQIVFMVPSGTAKKLKARTLRRLTKLANQLDDMEEEDDDNDLQDILDEEGFDDAGSESKGRKQAESHRERGRGRGRRSASHGSSVHPREASSGGRSAHDSTVAPYDEDNDELGTPALSIAAESREQSGQDAAVGQDVAHDDPQESTGTDSDSAAEADVPAAGSHDRVTGRERSEPKTSSDSSCPGVQATDEIEQGGEGSHNNDSGHEPTPQILAPSRSAPADKPNRGSSKQRQGILRSNRQRSRLKRGKKEGQRRFSDTWSFVPVQTMLISIPVMLMFAWVIVRISLFASMLNRVIAANERLVSSQRLASDLVRTTLLAGEFMFATNNLTRSRLIDEMQIVEERILQTSERIVLGATFVDESTGLENQLGPVEDVVARRIMLDDGCYGSDLYDECSEVGGQILTHGIRNAAIQIVRLQRSIRLSLPDPDLESGLSLFMLSQPEIFIVKVFGMIQIVYPHVRVALERGSGRYAREALAVNTDGFRLILITSSAMLAAALLFTAYAYWGAPERLALPVRAAWQAVRVLPTAVWEATPRAQQALLAELSKMQLGEA